MERHGNRIFDPPTFRIEFHFLQLTNGGNSSIVLARFYGNIYCGEIINKWGFWKDLLAYSKYDKSLLYLESLFVFHMTGVHFDVLTTDRSIVWSFSRFISVKTYVSETVCHSKISCDFVWWFLGNNQ